MAAKTREIITAVADTGTARAITTATSARPETARMRQPTAADRASHAGTGAEGRASIT